MAILASTTASAGTKPSASAAAALLAKVQPVPWWWGVATRGRPSQPLAWGLVSQSSQPAPGCVGAASPPVMATLLTWVAATHSAWRGFSYLFVFSLGMCALLMVVGLSSGSVGRLPRAGAWMLRVKKVFALLMLGMGEYYLLQAGQVWF